MNVRRFAQLMVAAALLGLFGSYAYHQSGDWRSSFSSLYQDEMDTDRQLRIRYAGQDFYPESARETRDAISDARAERKATGKTLMFVFAGIGLVAGCLLAASPKSKGYAPDSQRGSA